MTFSRPSISQVGISTDFDRPRTPGVDSLSVRQGPIGGFTPGVRSTGPGLGGSIAAFFADIAPSIEKGLNDYWDNQAKSAMADFFNANPGITARSLGDDPGAQAALLQMNPRARDAVAAALANTALADVSQGYAAALLSDPQLTEGMPVGADQTQWMAQQRLRRQEIYQQQLEASGFGVLPKNQQAEVLTRLAPVIGEVNGKLRGVQALDARNKDNAILSDGVRAAISTSVAAAAYGDGLVPPMDEASAIDVTATTIPRGGDFSGGAASQFTPDPDAEQTGYDVTLPGGAGGLVPSPIEGLRITGTGMQGYGRGATGRGYGNWVSGEFKGKDGKTYELLLGHFDRVNVKVGDVLSRGELIGHQGETGRSFGPHVTTHVNAKQGGDPWGVLKNEVIDPWIKGWKRDPAAATAAAIANRPPQELPSAQERQALAQQAEQAKMIGQQGFDGVLQDLLDGGRSYTEAASITVSGLQQLMTELAIGPGSSSSKAQAQLNLLNRTMQMWEQSGVKRGNHSLLHVPMGDKGVTPKQWINEQRAKLWAQVQDDPELLLQSSPDAWQAAASLAMGRGTDAERAAYAQQLQDYLLGKGLGIAKTADFLTAALGSGEQFQNFRSNAEVEDYELRNPRILSNDLTQEEAGRMMDEILMSDLSGPAKTDLLKKLQGANRTAGETAIGELQSAGREEYLLDLEQARRAAAGPMSQLDPATRQLAAQDPDGFRLEFDRRVKAGVEAEVAGRRAKGENLDQEALRQIAMEQSRKVREQYIRASQGGGQGPVDVNAQYKRAIERINFVRQSIEYNGGQVTPEVFPEDLRRRVGNDVRKLESEFERELEAVRKKEGGEIKAPFGNRKWLGGSQTVMQKIKQDAQKNVLTPGETTNSQAQYERQRRNMQQKLEQLGQPPALLDFVSMPPVPATSASPPAPNLPAPKGAPGSGGSSVSPKRQDYVDTFVASGMASNLGVQLSPRANDDAMVSVDPAGALRSLLNRSGIPNMLRIMSGQERLTPSTPALPQVNPTAKTQPLPTTISSKSHPLAVAIGIAEGTRTPDGGRTKAWYGHADPNIPGRRNIGTYSANASMFSTPEQADAYWDRRLTTKSTQAAQLLQRLGLRPDQVGYHRIMFNVLDLEIQAPAANRMDGFLGKLAEVVKAGASIEAIAKARADSYYNPKTGKLETSFRSYADLLADQRRRAGAFDHKKRLN